MYIIGCLSLGHLSNLQPNNTVKSKGEKPRNIPYGQKRSLVNGVVIYVVI
jgi:hypothetical protein